MPPNIIRSSFIPYIIITPSGINCLIVKQTNTVSCISLSAKGSMACPNLVIRLYFLAIYPSRISVIPAKRNIKIEYSKLSSKEEKNTLTNNGISAKRKAVIMFGKFIIVAPLFETIYRNNINNII